VSNEFRFSPAEPIRRWPKRFNDVFASQVIDKADMEQKKYASTIIS
jgi:hypothetical protein